MYSLSYKKGMNLNSISISFKPTTSVTRISMPDSIALLLSALSGKEASDS